MIEINGKEVDVRKVLPLTLGDYEDLEGNGVPQSAMNNLSVKQVRIMVEHIMHKANAAITTEDVRGLTLHQMSEVQREITAGNSEDKAEVPT